LIRPPVTWLRGIAAAAVAVVAVALPSGALAASGTTKLALAGPAVDALRQQGVRIAPLAPASGGGQRISLPLAAGLAGSSTTLLRQRGGIVLEAADGGKARLTGLSLLLGERSLVEAKLDGEKIELFKVLRGGRRDVDPALGNVRLAGLRLKLVRGAARAIARRLDLEPLPAQRFATLSANLSGLTPGGAGGSSPSGPAQKPIGCPLPSGAGPAGESSPPTPTRPGGAVDIAAATIDWHVRDSFIRYIASGEGTSVSAGASAEPPQLTAESSVPLSYDFHFPFASGWIDRGANPASPSDDTAALYFSGAIRFHYSGHGIDLVAANPEIEIAGGSSRAIFSVTDNGGLPQRQVLVNLDLGRAASIAQSGGSFLYERVPGAIPSGTANSVFAGFYTPGTDFGCFGLSFSTAG